MTVSSIELFQILKKKLGEQEAETLAKYVEDEVRAKFEEHKTELATKTDLAELKSELIKWVVGIGAASFIALAGLLVALFTYFK